MRLLIKEQWMVDMSQRTISRYMKRWGFTPQKGAKKAYERSDAVKDSKRKVFLILDNLRVHHAKLVKSWLEEHEEQIEVHYLPAYTPDLNPDEYMNCDLKQGIRASSPARSQEPLKKKVLSHMRKPQRLPNRVMSLF
ncbi:MAG: transposase [bacterium]